MTDSAGGPGADSIWDDERDVPSPVPESGARGRRRSSGTKRSSSSRGAKRSRPQRGRRDATRTTKADEASKPGRTTDVSKTEAGASSGVVRVRKRTRPKRRRWPWAVLGLGVIVLVAGGVLARDAIAVRAHLTAVQDQAGTLQTALRAGDVDGATALASSAAAEADAATRRTDGLLWVIAAQAPFVGDDVTAVIRLVDLADAATSVADVAVREASPMLLGDLQLLSGPRQLDLDQLAQLNRTVDGIDLDRLRAATQAVRDVRPAGLLAQVADAREEALVVADRALGGLDTADVALDLLPGFFGAEGPRAYIVGLQTNAELRGTGGLMTYFSVMSANRGRIDVQPAIREQGLIDDEVAEVDAAIDLAAGNTGEVAVPDPTSTPTETPTDAPSEAAVPTRPTADAPEDFQLRYDHLLARSDYGNVNVDPDLSAVGPVLAQLASLTGGTTYDGVIMLDPIALQTLLRGSPPLAVPEDLNAPGLPNPIPVNQLAQVLLVDNYDAFGGENRERQPYLKAVAQVAIQQAFDQLGDPQGLLDSFGEAVATRHLQVWTNRPREAALFNELGAGGRMARPQDGTDVLAVTGNNAAADKKDVHVSHRITADFQLRDLARAGAVGELTNGQQRAVEGGADVVGVRTGLVTVELINPLTVGSHDSYILGSALPEQLGSPRTLGDRVAAGPARTWFTIWNPEGFGARQVTVAGERVQFGSGGIHDLSATDYFLEVPLDASASFTADIVGPVGLRRDGDELVYTLTLWRQAKAIPDVWDLTLRSPADLVVTSAEVRGGGTGLSGFGPDQPGPLELTSSPAMVHVTGGATRDAVIEIRYGLAPK